MQIVYCGIVFTEPNNPDVSKVHYMGITHRDVRNGTLKRQPCEICGKEKTDAHHEVYAEKDYKIRWLCHKHHKIIHALFGNEHKKIEEKKFYDWLNNEYAITGTYKTHPYYNLIHR